MKHKFTLPSVIDDGRIDSFLKLINVAKSGHGEGLEIELDWSKTVSISPAGYAVLASVFDIMVEQKTVVTNKNISAGIMGLPVVANINKISSFGSLPRPDINNFENKTMIVRGVEGGINTMFTERLTEKFAQNISGDLLYSSTLIVNELMQNSADHSAAERHYLYAGIWDGEFHVGLLDMGVSIPAKLEQKYLCVNDIEYLELALKKGTSTRRQRVGGFGLYYFFDLLKENEGKLTIVSRRAQIRRYFRTRRSQKNILKYPLNGTWCFARFAPVGGIK